VTIPTATVQYQPSGHDFRVIIHVGAGTTRRQVFATVVNSDTAVLDELALWHVPADHATVIPAAG
jgi:hypothetical protein